MYLLVIAWLYVTLLMGLAEAFSSQGTILGAVITFLLYGVLPMSLAMYLMGTPLRRREIRRQEAHQQEPNSSCASSVEPDAGSHSPTVAQDRTVPSVRKEP
ncbi:hypothetical protein B9Z51_13850 [Limnohabitans sp. T6-5]|nr:hypothetical protein [Limnohabitans sp. T6-5]PUE07277.1 hypothetical protein B9Z51_13850 [Limnohabitans sp. T6-5]